MFPNRLAWPPEYPSVVSCEPWAVVRPPGVVAVPVLMFTETPPGAMPRLRAVVRRTVLAALDVRPAGAEPIGNGVVFGPIQSLSPVIAAGLDARGASTPGRDREEHAARRAAAR